MTIHVIVNRKTGAEIERFEGLSERGFRGLMMRVDSSRFRVEMFVSKESADKAAAAHAKGKAVAK